MRHKNRIFFSSLQHFKLWFKAQIIICGVFSSCDSIYLFLNYLISNICVGSLQKKLWPLLHCTVSTLQTTVPGIMVHTRESLNSSGSHRGADLIHQPFLFIKNLDEEVRRSEVWALKYYRSWIQSILVSCIF